MSKRQSSKDSRVKTELAKLSKSFSDIPENLVPIVTPLMQNSAFMKVTLEDLQLSINQNGTSDEYKNGQNQYGTKASAELQAYNSLIKNYAMVQEKLSKLLPKEEKPVSRFAEMDFE